VSSSAQHGTRVPLSILYVDYEFPGVTTTFTWREVEILESLGASIVVMSTRPAREHLLPERARALVALTHYVQRPSPGQCWRGFIRMAARRPGRITRCLGLLLSPVRPVSKYPSYLFHLVWATHVASTTDLSEFDCIHAPFAAGQGSMALFLSTLLDKPLWITSHAYDIYSDQIALRRKLKAASLFVTISSANRDWLVAKFGDVAQKVRVSYLGIDPREIHYSEPDELGAVVRMVSVGSLNPKKGHDVLLRALSGLRNAGLEFHCSIIGEGPERPVLERLVAELGLGPYLTLMGSIPNDRTQQIVAGSDLFVLACKHGARGDMDGIPVALMEAMAMGVPVVSTRISGIPELVLDGVTGFLAEPEDPRTLENALRAALGDCEMRRAVSLRARAVIEATFDQRRNTTELYELVREAVQGEGIANA